MGIEPSDPQVYSCAMNNKQLAIDKLLNSLLVFL